jgi:hypothetical protein
MLKVIMRRALLLLWALVSCAPELRPPAVRSEDPIESDDPPPAMHPAVVSGATCVDHDGDGYGEHCAAGVDCDDQDATTRDECFRCATASEGCACALNERPRACDVDTGGPVTDATCWIGQRSCAEGFWGRCTAYSRRFD